MLVLSRKKGEAIQIADNVRISIVEIRGGRVRLSIDAPRSVRVIRSELIDGDPASFDSDETEYVTVERELVVGSL